jgi:Na+-driven multidrug efflux pump
MINVKEHFRLTGLYTFFAAFPAVLQLVVYPIIEGNDRLGAEDFGYLAVAEALLSFLVMFALYGMSVTISRFYFDVKDDPSKYKRLVSTIFTGVIIRSILIIGIVILFAISSAPFLKHLPSLISVSMDICWP